MLIAKRYGNQLQDLRHFIRPGEIFYQERDSEKNALCEALDQRTGPEQHDVWLCWNWVCQNVAYPPFRNLAYADWHREQAFLRYRIFFYSPVRRRISYDFWQYPYETLELPMMGDCEDTSFLLCSILRNIMPASEAWVCLGWWNYTYAHAWVSVAQGGSRFVLETAIDEAPAFETDPYRILEADAYTPVLWVNDQEIIWKEPLDSYLLAPKAKVEEIRKAYEELQYGSMVEEIREAYEKLEVR